MSTLKFVVNEKTNRNVFFASVQKRINVYLSKSDQQLEEEINSLRSTLLNLRVSAKTQKLRKRTEENLSLALNILQARKNSNLNK